LGSVNISGVWRDTNIQWRRPFTRIARYLPGNIGRATSRPAWVPTGGLGQKGSNQVDQNADNAAPWKSFTMKRVRKVDRKLSNGVPVTGDVKQGGLPNCPIAAILAALAHTVIGQKHIDSMITEYIGAAVKTTLSDSIMTTLSDSTSDDPDYNPQDKEIISNRYFTVKLPGKLFEVHDTFYVKYTDDDSIDLVFMDSPNQVLWPCVIEKACALKYVSYNEMGNYKKHTANDFWEVLVGPKQRGFKVTDATDIERIREAVKGASTVPTIGASREDARKVTPWHGYSVLGIQDSTIELYNPAAAKQFRISLEDFRNNFQLILFGIP
jgi:hypothetical protein